MHQLALHYAFMYIVLVQLTEYIRGAVAYRQNIENLGQKNYFFKI